MTDAVRVLLADDHPLYRKGLHQLIDSLDGAVVVGEVEDGAAAVEQAQLLQPDVIVMDLNMPGVDGVEATRQVVAASPHIGVLVLTMHDDDESVFAAMRAGALGYVLKGASPDNMIRAIGAVASGEAIFGAGVARRALAYLNAPQAAKTPFAALTPREHDVLRLIATGIGNAAIAARLGLAPNTVSNHISSIFAKLQVASRAEAIVRARSAGLG
jgi:DNA-binding NarL/FixJ family response regulator